MLGKVEFTDRGMFATVTLFGTTKRVRVTQTSNMCSDGIFDRVLYIERYEDWYALSSPELKNLRVIVIKREDWRDIDDCDLSLI